MNISFEALDTDGNGQITQPELQAMGAARFDNTDTDGNGVLSAGELTARAQQHVGKRVTGMIERLDIDGDGVLSRDEMPRPRQAGRMFAHFDEDGSGGISEQEFNQAKAKISTRGKGRLGGYGPED
ncbi:MAG: calcium-binding protein [Rhodobacteraceae bacterium]|nr:calcium-binding protein [Paracoccaceae bacterium]